MPCKEGVCPGKPDRPGERPRGWSVWSWSSLHGARLDRSAPQVLVPGRTAAEHWRYSRDRPPKCVSTAGARWLCSSPQHVRGAPLLRQLPARTARFSVHSPRDLRLSRPHPEWLINVAASFPRSGSWGGTEEPGVPWASLGGPSSASLGGEHPALWGLGNPQGALGFEHRPPRRTAGRRGAVSPRARPALGQVPGSRRGERGHTMEGGPPRSCTGLRCYCHMAEATYRKIRKASHRSERASRT